MKVNATNIVSLFKQQDLTAYVSSYTLGNVLYRGAFPLVYNEGMSFSQVLASAKAKVMADIVSLGSQSPKKGREFVESVKGDIPKILIGRSLTERDQITIQSLEQSAARQPQNSAIINRAYELIYGDTTFVLDGINARLEYLSKQLASTGKYTTTTSNNEGGVAGIEFDFGVKTQASSKKWALENADPISDFIAVQEEADKTGKSYQVAYMDKATSNIILNNKNTQAFVYGLANNGGVIPMFKPSLERLNDALSAQGLPVISVWNTSVGQESDGSVTNVSGWESGNVLFAVDSVLGSTLYTTTPEFVQEISAGTTSKVVSENAFLVKVWGEEDPILITTNAVAFATPVLKDAKDNLILTTK